MNNLVHRFLFWLSGYLPIRPIYHDQDLYLERYHLCFIFGSWRVYLHHFVGDDPDGLHNHPFKYAFSIVLAGFYYEQRRYGYRKISWFNWLNADTFHRVRLNAKGLHCWTLFFHSPRITGWGFLRNKGIFTQYIQVNANPERFSYWHHTAMLGKEWRRLRQSDKNYLRSRQWVDVD